jgi:signal transduction histidine kinase
VARLEKLTREILQFSRPAPPQKMRTDAREIIEAVCRLVADQARRQHVEIVRPAEWGGAAVMVDAEQVKQVLINILINAIQAQPDGGRIVIAEKVEAGEWVASIRDAGPGMTPEQLEKIFDPFYTTKWEGTGLGLSISYQLVKNNGGWIRTTSGPGKGACFQVAFPAL